MRIVKHVKNSRKDPTYMFILGMTGRYLINPRHISPAFVTVLNLCIFVE